MIELATNRLDFIINNIPQTLLKVGEKEMSEKLSIDKWSKKEILGHLIDSATINHHRFVRGQFENKPQISYDQNKWNEYSYYQKIETQQIIKFWTIYNTQLLEIIKRIPSNYLNNKIKIGDNFLSLDFVINDYVEHLEYHLKQIVDY